MSDHEVRTESETGGQKGTKLARYDLIPANPLNEIASRFGLGAMKYEGRNWERGYEWSKSYAALQRHAWAFWSGEDDDELGEEVLAAQYGRQAVEDMKAQYGRVPGSSHLAAIAQHAMFMLEWLSTHPEFDDRVKPDLDRWAPDPETETRIRHEAAKRAKSMRMKERGRELAEEMFGQPSPSDYPDSYPDENTTQERATLTVEADDLKPEALALACGALSAPWSDAKFHKGERVTIEQGWFSMQLNPLDGLVDAYLPNSVGSVDKKRVDRVDQYLIKITSPWYKGWEIVPVGALTSRGVDDLPTFD